MKQREAIELYKVKDRKPQPLEGRAENAVADFLIKNLVLPTIFFDAAWTRGLEADVLAIDRGGSGDVHVVDIKKGIAVAKARVRQLLQIPANYRWIAIVPSPGERHYSVPPDLLMPSSGPGRIGVIKLVTTPDERLAAEVEVTAERFPGALYKRADRFKARHKADIEFR